MTSMQKNVTDYDEGDELLAVSRIFRYFSSGNKCTISTLHTGLFSLGEIRDRSETVKCQAFH